MQKSETQSCHRTANGPTEHSDAKEPLRLIGAKGPLRCGARSPRAPHLAAGCAAGTIQISDLDEGHLLSNLSGPPGAIEAVAFEDQGVLLA